jgi:carboxyl-terminal processing protease
MDETGTHRARAALSTQPMTFRTRLVVLLVSTPLVAFAVVGGLLGKTVSREESYQHLRIFEDVVSLIVNNYVEDVDVDNVMEGAMRGLADGLDADTSYLSPAEVGLVERKTPLGPGQVGLTLTRQYYLRVVAAETGSPAGKAGLRTGDYVRAIDGAPTRHMSLFEGTRRLPGPVGSKLELTVLRGSATEPHTVTLVREALVEAPVASRVAAPGIGLVRVSDFSGNVAAQFQTAVETLQKSGVDRLVIDLRATARGPIENGIAAARVFVPTGTLAQREARGQSTETISANPGDGAVTLPVALLVTGGTSGAAEVFAAALAGNGRAELIGEQTLGRAGLQKVVKFSDGSGLLLTWARFLTPAGKALHGSGLEPTVRVEEPDIEFGDPAPATDPILDKALERLARPRAA